MNWIIILGIIIIVIVALFILLMWLNNKLPNKMPYQMKQSILTDREKEFMKLLQPVAEEMNLIVFSKVRLADIVSINKGTKEYQKWFNKVSAKHIDYVLSDKDYNIVLLVELDDSSHNSEKAKANDEFKNQLFGSKLVRFRTMKEDIKAKLTEALNPNSENP